MPSDERVHALTVLGFKPRQASFLVLVMLHAGVCLARQYCTHAGIVRGQKSHDFFTRLQALGFATASRTAHHGTWLYHLHGKRLYRAIGEADHCHRRPVSLGRGIERLMILDGVLADPKTTWLATAQEKLEHFQKVTSLPPDQMPSRGTAHARAIGRSFPDPVPIGCPRDDQPHVFVYLVSSHSPLDFRGFLHRHAPLLRALNRWEIRLLVPGPFMGSVHRFESAAVEELAVPLPVNAPADLNWYFEQRRLVDKGAATGDPARFTTLRRAFAAQRYWALYRTWQTEGTTPLFDATSPLLSAAMDADDGRVTRQVLEYDYLRLTTLAGTA